MAKESVKILLVEDQAIIRLDVHLMLTKMGYEVLDFAASGEDAVEKARELKPDLILMDVFLDGEMDGIEAAAVIKRELGIPVVYLTGNLDEATVRRALATEPHGYIVKPATPRVINKSIENFVRNRLARDMGAETGC